MTERGENQKTERRRRNGDALQGKRRRLKLDEKGMDREKYVYRWTNDEGTRIHDLTVNDDWDVVQDRSGTLKADGQGAQVSVPVGVGDRGAPVKAVLLRKPKDLHDEDYRLSQRRIDATEAAIKKGENPETGARDEKTYSSVSINFGD